MSQQTKRYKTELSKNIISLLTNTDETPKEKKINAIIALTYGLEGALEFWEISNQHTAKNKSQFTTWKFCYLLHRILREGANGCVDHTQIHLDKLYEMAMMWVWQRNPLSQCIAQYCRVLIAHIQFQRVYKEYVNKTFEFIPEMPFHNMDFCYELCQSLANNLDTRLTLEEKIFTAVRSSNLPFDTQQGHSRCTPLLVIALECERIYQQYEILMWILCTNLSMEFMANLIDTFNGLFERTKQFKYNLSCIKCYSGIAAILEHVSNERPNFNTVFSPVVTSIPNLSQYPHYPEMSYHNSGLVNPYEPSAPPSNDYLFHL